MKTIDEIYQEMLSCFGEQTGMDLGEGCDLSARLYALAAQVYALYVQADWVTRQAFPQTARDEYLDRHAQLRGLTRKQGTRAAGTVRFSVGSAAPAALDIPVGTVCMTAGLVRFETTQAGTIAAGSTYADVPVRALLAGTAGNVAKGTIVSMAVAPVGVSACTNPAACSGGADQESDENLRARVMDTFKRLPNGANAAFYQQGAMSFDQVAAAAVISRPRGVGTVDVVVAAQNGIPDSSLLEKLTAYFEERREIAVDLRVKAPVTVKVDLSVRVRAKEGYDPQTVRAGVENALTGRFTGELLGRDVLRAWLGSVIYACEGVDNYQIAAPAADVPVAADELPVLGTLTVEAMT